MKISTDEFLSEVGQENEKKGIKSLREFMSLFEKQEWENDQIKKEKLDKARFTRQEYHHALRVLIDSEIPDLDIHKAFKLEGFEDDKGVGIKLTDWYGKVYKSAFKPCGVPKVDYGAVVELLGRVLNTTDLLEQEAKDRLKVKNFIV